MSAQVPVPGAVPYGAGRGEQVYRSVPLSRAAPVSEGGPAAMWSAPAPTLRPHPTGHGLSPPLASPWQLQSEAQSSVLFIKLFGVEGDRGKRRMEEGKGGEGEDRGWGEETRGRAELRSREDERQDSGRGGRGEGEQDELMVVE